MGLKWFLPGLAFLGLAALSGRATAACSLNVTGEIPVTMVGAKPTIPAKVNGVDVRLTADTGSFISLLTPQAAARAGLKVGPTPIELNGLVGVGGREDVGVARASEFTIMGVTVHGAYFLVGAPQLDGPTDGLVGNNFLSYSDVEFDLANGVIRFFKPAGCGGGFELAYWAKSGAYSTLPIEHVLSRGFKIIGRVQVNGRDLKAIFDTGASRSFITRAAAVAAGVTTASAGVRDGGAVGGIGRGSVESWIAPFHSIQIGDELVSNPNLRIGEIGLGEADMLIGADFFLSHRVYVANSQDKLYFTYNGGPVFNLDSTAPDSAPPQVPATTAPAALVPGAPTNEPVDAAGFSRRGAAFAARSEWGRAIADFTKAAELEPLNERHLYDRATAEVADHQSSLAMADVDRALKLKADDADTLALRGDLRLAAKDEAGARSDFDHATRIDPALALTIGRIYGRERYFDFAVAEIDQWITANRKDVRLSGALNERCWVRALSGRDLDKALADCDAALGRAPHAPQFLDSRGLVNLRLGRLDKAIADYDESLRLQPKNAWSLYGRGLAEQRSGKKTHGDADIAAAVALSPRMPQEARKYGIAP
jgi:tetratricopeptide (TPR) repeat protein/predicted aspartyl protease